MGLTTKEEKTRHELVELFGEENLIAHAVDSKVWDIISNFLSVHSEICEDVKETIRIFLLQYNKQLSDEFMEYLHTRK